VLTFQTRNPDPEASNMKKPWSPNPNQSNIEWWNWKKEFQLYKMIKKIAINIMMIKIEKQNKFYIWLKDKIEKKNQFSKRKKIKRMRIKVEIKDKTNILMEGWSWKE
jgi:hypothetical protein